MGSTLGIENIEGWMEYSKNELGLEFDQEDMQTLAAEMGSIDELSEDQLEQVAGGIASSTAAAVVGAVAGVAGAAAGGAAAATAVTDNVRRGW